MNITPRLPQYPRKLPSLDEKVVWRIPGESWACSRPEFHFDWIHPPSGCVTHICDVCVEQAVFLTVYHRGPLPLRELHPTDETWMWRDPGGSWACLRPVSHYRWIRLARSCNTDVYVSSLWSRSFFLRWITADPSPWGNFTPPTTHECGETLGDFEPVYDLFSITGEFALPEAVTLACTWYFYGTRPAEKVVILTVNHRGALTSRELHHWNRIVGRPGWVGALLSLLKTCFRSPKAGTQTCGLLLRIFMWQKARTQACPRII